MHSLLFFLFFLQFRFATWFDWVIMFIGTIAGIAHGASLPILMIIFGDTADAFSNEFLSREIAGTVNESIDNLNCMKLNNICNTVEREQCGFFVDESLCATGDDLIDEINILLIYYCGLGVVAFVCGWLHVSLFQFACERQLHIIRRKFFHSVLRQEIGWFDVNSVGELNSRLNE